MSDSVSIFCSLLGIYEFALKDNWYYILYSKKINAGGLQYIENII